MSLSGRSLLDLPVGTFEVLRNGVGDLVLFVLGEGSAHATNAAKSVTQAHDGKAEIVSPRQHTGRM
jgi:hypothetical protein